MLNTLTEEEFFSGLYQVVHPSTPVAHSQGLCGRQREWRLLEQALSAPGRHALVYGAAGIGKTSLAHMLVAHHRLRCPPVKISCDPDSTLLSLMKHALTLGDSGMSRRHESVFGARFSLAGSGVKFEKKVVEQQCAAAIEDNATVVTVLEAWGERLQSPVWLIIDDLDRMARIEERRGFFTLFKQLADRACPVKMILVARGEQPEGVFGAGEAFTRHLSPVKLAPLTLKNGYEFISLCLDSFGLLMVERLKWRVAQACAGHPRKLHQVCERLLISAWERGGRHITPQQCQYALQCVRGVGPAPAGAGGARRVTIGGRTRGSSRGRLGTGRVPMRRRQPSPLADSHQCGIAARGGGIDADCAFD